MTTSVDKTKRRLDDALERHASYYASLMKQYGQETLLYLKGDVFQALEILDQNIRQMEQGQRHALSKAGAAFWDKLLIRYAGGAAAYFDQRGLVDQKLGWTDAGWQAAMRQDEQRDAAALLHNRGLTYRMVGDYDHAIEAFNQVIPLFLENGFQNEAAIALTNLGIVYQIQERYDEAIAAYERSMEIAEDIDSKPNLARALSNLGSIYAQKGAYEQAIAYHRASIDLKRGFGDIAGIALSTGNLGEAYQSQGDAVQAEELYLESLKLSRSIQYQRVTLDSSWRLNNLYQEQGKLEAALPLLIEAVHIAEEIRDPRASTYRAELDELRRKIAVGVQD